MISKYSNFNEKLFSKKRDTHDNSFFTKIRKAMAPDFDKKNMWIFSKSLKWVSPNTVPKYKYINLEIQERESTYGRPKKGDKFNIENLQKVKVSPADDNVWSSYSINGNCYYSRVGKLLGHKNRGGWLSIITNIRELIQTCPVLDVYDSFESLKSKSKIGGYNIGTEVYVKSIDNTGIITKIEPTCFYRILYSGTHNDYKVYDDIEVALTMSYMVNGVFYTIQEIELVKGDNKSFVDIDLISDIFVDLKDDGKITMSKEIFKNDHGEYFKYTIHFIPALTSSSYLKLSECYVRMCEILKQNDTEIELLGINMSEISFKVKSKIKN